MSRQRVLWFTPFVLLLLFTRVCVRKKTDETHKQSIILLLIVIRLKQMANNLLNYR